MAISKIILNGVTQMDLTSDTVQASNLIAPNTAHGADGQAIVGTASAASEPNLQSKTGIAPSTSSQTITADSGYDGLSSVQINAMPTGTAGTPSASKGTVSNHSVSVTPSVTNTTGYITGGTKTGTDVTVSASELVSGSETKTTNGTYDVTNLAELVVNVSGGNLGTKTITENGTYSADDDNLDGYSSVTVNVEKGMTFSKLPYSVTFQNNRNGTISFYRVVYNSTTIFGPVSSNVTKGSTGTWSDFLTDGTHIWLRPNQGSTISYNGSQATYDKSGQYFRIEIPSGFDGTIPFILT